MIHQFKYCSPNNSASVEGSGSFAFHSDSCSAGGPSISQEIHPSNEERIFPCRYSFRHEAVTNSNRLLSQPSGCFVSPFVTGLEEQLNICCAWRNCQDFIAPLVMLGETSTTSIYQQLFVVIFMFEQYYHKKW